MPIVAFLAEPPQRAAQFQETQFGHAYFYERPIVQLLVYFRLSRGAFWAKANTRKTRTFTRAVSLEFSEAVYAAASILARKSACLLARCIFSNRWLLKSKLFSRHFWWRLPLGSILTNLLRHLPESWIAWLVFKSLLYLFSTVYFWLSTIQLDAAGQWKGCFSQASFVRWNFCFWSAVNSRS